MDVRWASGLHGVMTFFILSGFLITWLLLKENKQTGTVSLRDFYLRRALRIFPAFYVFWILYVVLVSVFRHQYDWAQYLSSLFYVSNYYQAIVQPAHMAMAHAWSLGVEEQFYLLWPWIFLKLKDNPRKLTRFLYIAILVIWIHRLILFTVIHPGYDWLYGAFDCRADHLAIGCLMAVLIHRRIGTQAFAALTRNAWLPLIPLVLLGASVYMRSVFGFQYQFLVGFMLDPILTAILIIQWITQSDAPGWRWLNHPVCRYLGRISYSMYLYHWLVASALIHNFDNLSLWVKVLIAMGGSIVLASASYFWIEKPFLRLKKRFAHVRRTEPVEARVVSAF